MTKEKIDRINALARKSKTPEGLTPEEKAEQKALREEYIADFRRSTLAALGRIDIRNEDGSIEPLIKQ
ncbi:MAG: DUF896 domain-containing protein [Ruminococcaceae bacterium]|nr:DUF896 domain-containing protein [Oscillospiraceae bacterium]